MIMPFNITEEQLMIQNMAREFSRNVVAPGAAERDRTKEFPKNIFKKMGELGLMGIMVPEKYDGAGSDTIGYALALSEIAYSCASTAVVMSVHNSIVCESILKFGTEEQKEKFLKPLAEGKFIGAFGLTEPQAGSDPSAQIATAVKEGDYYILNGIKRFITSALNCGLAIITAKTDPSASHKGISAFIVEKGTPGFSAGPPEEKMGLRASDTADLIFNNCKIPAKNLLGSEGDGFKIAMTALDSGRIGIAAQSIGVAKAAFDAAVKYAKEREQFGKRISQYQGIRWVIADMEVEIEASMQLMLSAAAMKDRGERHTKQAAIAKLFSSEMVNRTVSKAIQVFGGYGYINEYPVERFYRDARVFMIYEGTSEIQRIVISNQILKDKAK
jgi:butyryl-CoA dehydrogenase